MINVNGNAEVTVLGPGRLLVRHSDGEEIFYEFGTDATDDEIQTILDYEINRRLTTRKVESMQRNLKAMEAWSTLKKQAKIEKSDPPLAAESLFAWLVPKATVDAQLGDLQEIFSANVAKHGYKRARRLYWMQVIRAVSPALFRAAKRIGIVGFLIDYVRTKFGL